MIGLLIFPCLACLILVGIHTHLGLHVIKRGVIFVDLCLAQMAALGTVVALLLGYTEQAPWITYAISLGFTFTGAWILSQLRSLPKGCSQEAVIGILYALSTALSLLLLSKMPSESHQIESMLTGNILLVDLKETLFIATLYSVVGLIHWKFHSQFEEKAGTKAWDFFIYLTLGAVVTSSVKVGGVMLMFAYLIIPAMTSFLIAKKRQSQLFLGWSVGWMASIIGIAGSVYFDLPTGSAIISVLGLSFFSVLVFRKKLSSINSSVFFG